MDRKEPKIGDLSQIEFRSSAVRQRTTSAAQASGNGLVWKIALGVFAGMCLFGLATCSGLVVLGAAVQQAEQQQTEAAVQEFVRAANDPDPFGWGRAEQQRQRRIAEDKALQPGERCIDGKRLQRVSNGWVQVDKPC